MPLADSCGRQITYLRVSVTDRCNLRCRYCMPADGITEQLSHAEIMTYEEALRLIRIFAGLGVSKIRITGGEPLVRKGLPGFVRAVSAVAGIDDLSLTTNGSLLAERADELKAAGLHRVNISLDTLDPAKFEYITRGGSLKQVQEGIAAALRSGLAPLKLNVVAIRGFNEDELAAFAALTVEKPVHVRFIELMPVGCAARLEGDEIPLRAAEIVAAIETVHGALQLVGFGSGPACNYRIANARGLIGLIDPLSEKDFCARCNRLRLTAAGRLRLCLFSNETVELLGPLRNGSTDAELISLIRAAVIHKPFCRADNRSCPAAMSSIGG